MQFLVGADPELFGRSRTTGAFISCHEMIDGTKQNPLKCNAGALQIDGTALEFNIDPAASCDEFVDNIRKVRAEMDAAVAKFDIDIVTVPVAEFDEEYFKTLPAYATELGCTPDYNAWSTNVNPIPDAEMTFRTGSGHVHIGWGSDFDVDDKDHFMACCVAARQLDYYLGVNSLRWDADDRRRKLYGSAGAFRPKSYGLEYRVMSNRWLESEALQRFVYNSAIAGMNALVAGNDLGAKFGNLAEQIINNNEVDWADRYDFGTEKWAA